MEVNKTTEHLINGVSDSYNWSILYEDSVYIIISEKKNLIPLLINYC